MRTSKTVWLSLALWVVASTLVCSTLLARHLLPLPPRQEGAPRALSAGLAALKGPGEGRTVFHVLYADCRCSQRIADHLAHDPRPAGVTEHVLLVDDHGVLRPALEGRFALHDVSSAELTTRFDVVAAPMFVVAGPTGKVEYMGGYTDRKQAPDPRDREIIEAAARGAAPRDLPLYGCAVAEDLKRQRNPLWLP